MLWNILNMGQKVNHMFILWYIFICPDQGSHSFEGWSPSQYWQLRPGHEWFQNEVSLLSRFNSSLHLKSYHSRKSHNFYSLDLSIYLTICLELNLKVWIKTKINHDISKCKIAAFLPQMFSIILWNFHKKCYLCDHINYKILLIKLLNVFFTEIIYRNYN